MKKIIIIIFAFSISAYSFGQQNKSEITFEKTVIDYGTVEKGANGIRDFVFTNTGDAPLIISNVKSTCGCTIPKKPEKPIMPGESDKIQVKYDTKRIGKFTKTITLTTNSAEKTKILTIKGEVQKPVTAPVAPAKPATSPLEVR